MFVCNSLRPYETKYDIIIVDEVDNMFIDQGISHILLSELCDIIFLIYIKILLCKNMILLIYFSLY